MFNTLKKTIFILILFVNSVFASDTIKIALIEKITHFIKWPELNKEFVIGIYKDQKIRNMMIEIYADKKIHKLPIRILNIKNKNDAKLKEVNLLYFTKESSKNVDLIFKKVKDYPVLIITDFPNDVYQGMHLGLYFKNKRIKFIINQEALENAQLKASYKILKLAKIVKEKN